MNDTQGGRDAAAAPLQRDAALAHYSPSASRLLRPQDFVPTRYMLLVERRQCACGQESSSYQCVLVKEHPSGGAGSTISVPVETRSMELPIGRSELRVRHIPFCGSCWHRHWTEEMGKSSTEEGWKAAMLADAALRAKKREQEADRRAAAARRPVDILHDLELP